MIKNIIFDIGNVLAKFGWQEKLDGFGFPEDIRDRVADATCLSEGWNEYDRGTLTDKEIEDLLVSKDPGVERQIRAFLNDFSDLVTPLDYAIPWIDKLDEEGFDCYYLSNFSEKAERECSEALKFIPRTKGGILSYQEKVIKPDPEIYGLLLDRYGLAAEESIFIDDTTKNVRGAEKLGIHGIIFKNREQADRQIHELAERYNL